LISYILHAADICKNLFIST